MRISPYHTPQNLEELIKGGHVEAVLAALLKHNEEEAGRQSQVDERQCPTCGLPLRSYRETLFLGCSDCYEAFEDVLIRDLRKYHGATKHCGRAPSGENAEKSPLVALEELRRQLEVAVAREDFELAARLRDEIKKLKAQIHEANPQQSNTEIS
jgi:protein-arginine kinase activator protein McsA